MATLPHNIEKSAFRKGEYVGYAAGYVFRISRADPLHDWTAQPTPIDPYLAGFVVFSSTLAGLSEQLDALKIKPLDA